MTKILTGKANPTIDFNSHAHVERDLGFPLKYAWSIWISTHTLTWSVTWLFVTGRVVFTDFNSHAHVERDAVALL